MEIFIISGQSVETNIRSTVNSVISSLNEFKAEIDRLTFIDLEGDANGPLALDPAVNSIKSSFKKLAVEPINGYGEKSIYLSQLGIKTDNNGDYFLDDTLFKKTFSSNPESFNPCKYWLTPSSLSPSFHHNTANNTEIK